MSKGLSYKLAIWGNFILVSLLIPLLINSNAWGQKSCSRAYVNGKIEQLKDDKKRETASDELVKCGESAIAFLTKALSGSDAVISGNAALIMGEMGAGGESGVSALVKAVKDSNEDNDVRSSAASALIKIGRGVEKKADSFTQWDLEGVDKLEGLNKSLGEVIAVLEKDKQSWKSKKSEIKNLSRVSRSLEIKLDELKEERFYQVRKWVEGNPWVWLAVGYLVGYLGIFIVRPIWLLKLDEFVKPAKFTIPVIKLPVSLGHLVFLKYHPRVLDAWVNNNLDSVKEEFFEKDIVKRERFAHPLGGYRYIHLPLPVVLNGKTLIPNVDWNEYEGVGEHKPLQEELYKQMSKKQFCLLIQGEGGAGKTSLACQIAAWGCGFAHNVKF